MQLLPLPKSCPGAAAGLLLHVLRLAYNCLLYIVTFAKKLPWLCCWFSMACPPAGLIVCCTPCWGEALLPSKKTVFECFGIRISKYATFCKKAALALLLVFYCVCSCWFLIVCCTPCWGEALLPSKKIVFECFGIRAGFFNQDATFAFP